MWKTYVHTPIGILDIGEAPEGFVSGEPVGVTLGGGVLIKSCLTKVIITKSDGSKEIVQPVVIESCMNPEIKTVMPVTVEAKYHSELMRYIVTVSNPYKKIVLDIDRDIVAANTEKYVPHIKRADCAECNNCGRC